MIFIFPCGAWEIVGLTWEVSLPASNLGQHGGSPAPRLVEQTRCLCAWQDTQPQGENLELKCQSPFLTSHAKSYPKLPEKKGRVRPEVNSIKTSMKPSPRRDALHLPGSQEPPWLGLCHQKRRRAWTTCLCLPWGAQCGFQRLCNAQLPCSAPCHPLACPRSGPSHCCII